MTDFMDIIRGRRSVRKYKDDPVPEEALNTILESVRWAPSWANTQCWEVIVVKDEAVRQGMQAALPAGNPAFKAVVQAPVVLAVCAKLGRSGCYGSGPATKLGDWFMFDTGVACQNIALAAHSLGLGTVVVGLMDHDACKKVLNVPEGHELVCLMPLGYPAKEVTAPPRRGISDFTHREVF